MAKQLLYMVLGGELKDLNVNEFADLDQVEIIGLYPNYETAEKAWKAKAQGTVDDAMARFFIVHLHRLLNADKE